MHFYNFHPADFNNSARHLTLVERALYRDLIDMYYGDEQPIDVSDVARLERRLLCRTQDEKAALAYVLSEFFVKRGNKYHHHRIDREIKNYRHAHRNDSVTATVTDNNAHRNGNSNATVTEVTPLSNAERQQRNRAERKQMIDDLNMIGVSVTTSAGTKLLRELTDINADAIRNAKLSNTDDSNITDSNEAGNEAGNETGNGGNAEIRANNQEPETNNQEPITKNKYVNEVAEVFEFWKTTFGKMATTKLSDERKRKIIARLKDGYTVEQIKQAIVNCSQNEFNIAGGHTDIELICRDVKHLERYMELKPQKIQPQQPAGNSRFGTKDDPLAVDVVWNQPVAPVSQMTYEEWEAEEKAKQAARESVKTKGFEVIE